MSTSNMIDELLTSGKQKEKERYQTPTKTILPLGEPFYSTYHFQGIIGAVSLSNPSIRNWYLSNSVSLTCERVFLYGFSSPHLNIVNSSWLDTPCFDKYIHPTRFIENHIHELIRTMLDSGYYVNFDGVDDYYMDGKSWYGKRHFCHDGLIYGYDLEKDTYHVYAYDSQWVYRGFEVPRESFERGRMSMTGHGIYGSLCGVRPYDAHVEFDINEVYKHIIEYLDSSLVKYPLSGEGAVNGIVVHEYIAAYVDRLYHGLIQYNKMDWRIFRVLWEHKSFMLERIMKIEEVLKLAPNLSKQYKEVVRKSNEMRMMYASHRQKRRDSVLPIIKSILLEVNSCERRILEEAAEVLHNRLSDDS